MPFNLAQWTGAAVVAIVVSGSDLDIVYAVPIGLFAGALATLCCALAELNRPFASDRRRAAIPLKTAAKRNGAV